MHGVGFVTGRGDAAAGGGVAAVLGIFQEPGVLADGLFLPDPEGLSDGSFDGAVGALGAFRDADGVGVSHQRGQELGYVPDLAGEEGEVHHQPVVGGDAVGIGVGPVRDVLGVELALLGGRRAGAGRIGFQLVGLVFQGVEEVSLSGESQLQRVSLVGPYTVLRVAIAACQDVAYVFGVAAYDVGLVVVVDSPEDSVLFLDVDDPDVRSGFRECELYVPVGVPGEVLPVVGGGVEFLVAALLCGGDPDGAIVSPYALDLPDGAVVVLSDGYVPGGVTGVGGARLVEVVGLDEPVPGVQGVDAALVVPDVGVGWRAQGVGAPGVVWVWDGDAVGSPQLAAVRIPVLQGLVFQPHVQLVLVVQCPAWAEFLDAGGELDVQLVLGPACALLVPGYQQLGLGEPRPGDGVVAHRDGKGLIVVYEVLDLDVDHRGVGGAGLVLDLDGEGVAVVGLIVQAVGPFHPDSSVAVDGVPAVVFSLQGVADRSFTVLDCGMVSHQRRPLDGVLEGMERVGFLPEGDGRVHRVVGDGPDGDYFRPLALPGVAERPYLVGVGPARFHPGVGVGLPRRQPHGDAALGVESPRGEALALNLVFGDAVVAGVVPGEKDALRGEGGGQPGGSALRLRLILGQRGHQAGGDGAGQDHQDGHQGGDCPCPAAHCSEASSSVGALGAGGGRWLHPFTNNLARGG